MQNKEQGQETVLLRYPTPKYDFKGRKLSKTQSTVNSQPSSSVNLVQETGLKTEVSKKQSSDHGLKSEKDAINIKQKEIRSQHSEVGRSKSSLSHNVDQINSQQSTVSSSHTNDSQTLPGKTGTIPQTGVNSTKIEEHQNKPKQSSVDWSSSHHKCVCDREKSDVPLQGSTNLLSQVQNLNSPCSPLSESGKKGEEEKLEKENESLKKQLNVQLKVNAELKKLLIASVGEELESRVERLVRDKAELSEEVGGYTKKVTEDYENLDKISIQADMWRSKFLASRVMIEELASGRAFYATQYQESQDALQQLLTERHEVRAHLLECYRVLQQVKGAFDPLNTHRSSHLPSTNVIDLSKQAHQLAEAIRFRLLPGQLNLQTVIDIDSDNELTNAECFAQELVSRPVKVDIMTQKPCLNLFAPEKSRIERFHPEVNFENLTFYCCAKCKGEISVI